MSDESSNSDEEGFVLIANEILRKCQINGELESLAQCSDSFFVAVYEGILGEPLKGIIADAVSHKDQVRNCETVIDALSCDILNVDLSHISGEDIISGDVTSIQNLLEIFKELLDFILDIDHEGQEECDIQDDQNDSNILSSDHEVISDVLQQELGPSQDECLPRRGKLPEKTLNAEKPVKAFSSHHITDVDISMIPKWSRSASSSRSSACDSNSTDEIIRESEIIERQLAREYPLLHQPRELGAPKHFQRQSAPQDLKERTESKAMSDKTLMSKGPSATTKQVREESHIGRDKAEIRNVELDEERSERSSKRVIQENKLGTFRDIGTIQAEARVSRTLGFQKSSQGRDKTGEENGVVRDIRRTEVETRDSRKERELQDRGELREQHAAVRDVKGSRVVSKNLRSSSDERLHNRVPNLDTQGEPREPRETSGSHVESKVPGTSPYEKRLPKSRGENGTTRDFRGYRDEDRDSRSPHKDSRRLNRIPRPDPSTVGIESSRSRRNNDDRSSLDEAGVTNGLTNHQELTQGAEKVTTTHYENSDECSEGQRNRPIRELDNEKRFPFESDRLLTHAEGSNGKLREAKRTVVQPQVTERFDGSRLDGDLIRMRNSKAAEETEKSKLHSRFSGVLEEQRGLRLKHGYREDFREGLISGRHEEGNNYDGGDSDTSGALWDDQISPLDASEQMNGMATGLAFDKIGMSANRIDGEKTEAHKRLGKSRDKHEHGSSVFRHYHHHFHHPHGSSEDLVQDLEYLTRAERSEDRRPRSSIKSRRSLQQRPLGERQTKSSTKDEPQGKRSVKFSENVDTLLITNRLERLKKEMEKDEQEQGDRRLLMKSTYGGHLDNLNRERKRIEKDLKQVPKTVTKPSPRRQKSGVRRRVSRDHTVQAVYGSRSTCKRARFPSSKARKRSTSVSPRIQQRKKTAKQLEKGDVILPTMLEEFPFLHLSPHTMQTMRKKQTDQLLTLAKSAAQRRQTKTQKVIEDAEKRQQTLLKILRKDLLHNQRMREQKEREKQERAIKSKLHEKRQASARARRYYEDYQLRMRARLLKRRTREEQIFKNLFQDGLEIQKQRVQELRTYAREQREVRAQRQQNELESLENFYRDQYSILAETIAREKEALEIREKAQEKVIHQMQRNLRQKLQKEVTDIQETLVRDEDDAYFRRLDAERLRKQMQMAAFQNLS